MMTQNKSHPRLKHWLLFGIPALIIAWILVRVFVIGVYTVSSGSMLPTLQTGQYLFTSKLRYGFMNPLRNTSYLVQWATPGPGDVVTFISPSYVPRHSGETWVMRVVATSGQTVRLKDSVVYVDDKPCAHVTPGIRTKYQYFIATSEPIGKPGYWNERDGLRTVEQIGETKYDIYQNLPGEQQIDELNWPMSALALEGLECKVDLCRVKEGFLFVMGDNRGYSMDSRFWGGVPVDHVTGKAWFSW